MLLSSRKSRLVAFGVSLHALLIYSIFDVHFISPLVDTVEVPSVDFPAPAKRLVIIVADGLRADRLFEMEARPRHTHSPEDTEGAPSEHDAAPTVSPRAPFLHRIARHDGRWGVSHARPPTESRPGHVALLAGFYEDPSAITKGWQANAVEFDHVLNQSSAAWAIGAPSVVPLFSKGIPHVRTRMYPEELEDFSAATDHAALDEWVFDRTIEVLKGNVTGVDAVEGVAVDAEQAALEGSSDGGRDGKPVVFLLHLLGLDTAGHAHKPHGEGYAANVRTVDTGVARLSEAFKTRFGDDRTAFIFTADHGMSDRGSHGDGDPGCTETPLVAWGAGVASAAAALDGDGVSDTCRPRGKDAPTPEALWGLSEHTRCDVDQADVSSLAAALLGLPPPRHNSGILPVPYLDPIPETLRSGAAVANTAQLLSVYRQKAVVVAATSLTAFLTPGGLRPYTPLSGAEEVLTDLKAARARGDHAAAIAGAQALSHTCVEGTTYLHLYDRNLVSGAITLCFLGWIAFLVVNLALDKVGGVGPGPGRKGSSRYGVVASVVAAAMACVVCAILAARRAPMTYYAYFTLPVYFGWYCVRSLTLASSLCSSSEGMRGSKGGNAGADEMAGRLSVGKARGDVSGGRRGGARAASVTAAAVAMGMTQVLCWSFHDRTLFTWVFVAAWGGLSLFAGWLSLVGAGLAGGRWSGAHRRRAAASTSTAALAAAAGSLALAPFTLFSVDLTPDTVLVEGGVVCASALGLVAHYFLRPLDLFGDDGVTSPSSGASQRQHPGSTLFITQLLLLWAAGGIVWGVDGLQAGRAPIPTWLHGAAWGVATVAAAAPFFSPPQTLPRFTSVYLAGATVYTLFSVAYEALFYAALGGLALSWLVLERSCQRLAATSDALDSVGEVRWEGEEIGGPDLVYSSVPVLRGGKDGDRLGTMDARHPAVLLVLINAAFFGTGNIASVASFEISSVYRFTTRFAPFLMGLLLILKVLIPMLTVAVAFLALLKLQRVPSFPMYLVFLVLSDLMALRFFFQVTTEGSWQDIGISISIYSLMGTQVVTMLIFMGLADMYTRDLLVNGIMVKVVSKKRL